jgi:membrane protease YdiL (CAAX protease family)
MTQGSAGRFFGLVLILSLPFYALGLMGVALPFAPALPLSALMACVPMAAALLLAERRHGKIASAFAMGPLPKLRWTVSAFAIMPAAFAVTAGMLWLSGAKLPTLTLLPLGAVLPAFTLFFLGAVGEEVGWQGYAFPTLAARYTALNAALIIGTFWALWHVIPFAVMGRSAAWILWHSAAMVLMRLLIVWLVVNAGQGLLSAVLFHAMSNSVWGLFPDYDPLYDPKTLCAVLLLPVLTVIVLWGPATLAQFRHGRSAKASGDK